MIYPAAQNRDKRHKRNASAFLIFKDVFGLRHTREVFFLNACMYTSKSAPLAF